MISGRAKIVPVEIPRMVDGSPCSKFTITSGELIQDSNGAARIRSANWAAKVIDLGCKHERMNDVKALIVFVGWCILFVLCWPLAILALVLFPIVWLLSLPLRLIGITVSAVFA